MRYLLCLTTLTLAAPAHAGFMITPPAGDNPTPAGWLLVKFDHGYSWLRDPGSRFSDRPYQPSVFPEPNLYNNFPGFQFWTPKADPTFTMVTANSLARIGLHSLQAEVDAGLDQVSIAVGPVSGQHPNQFREFTYHEGAYSRTVSLPALIPEPSTVALAALALIALAGVRSRVAGGIDSARLTRKDLL
jgi:hypothetical protein